MSTNIDITQFPSLSDSLSRKCVRSIKTNVCMSVCEFDERIRAIKNRYVRVRVSREQRERERARKSVVKSVRECKEWLKMFVRMSEHQFSRYYDWFVVRDFYFSLLNDWTLSRRWADNVMNERYARANRKLAAVKVSIKRFSDENPFSVLPSFSHGRPAACDEPCEEYTPLPIRKKCIACKRLLRVGESSDDCACVVSVDTTPKVVVERPRCAWLAMRIREKIREMSLLRVRSEVLAYRAVRKWYPKGKIFGQMDIPQHGNVGGEVSVASNVVIEQEADVNPIIASTSRQDWTAYCANDKPIRADALTDRWLHAGSFVWTKSDTFGKDLMTAALPADFIRAAGNTCDAPNYIPFRISTFSHFESIDIKLLINSNKFQTGSCIAGFIYQTDEDLFSDTRYNPYSLSQVNHVKFYAGSMNEVSINIPYRNSLSMLYNQPNRRTNNVQHIGTLCVRVVNQLCVGTDVADHVNVNVQMKFNGLQFSGTRPGNWPQPQMETAAAVITANAAMSLLNTIRPDPNRDNPPLNAEPSYFVPTASHSWAAGTGRVDVNKILRLDTRGQTVHACGVEDAFTVNNLSSKLGLIVVKRVPISTTSRQEIISLPVEPMFGKKVGSKRENFEIANTYYFPPVSVVSSCFAYWRGSFKFVLDIVASQFITCKLICGYIPNVPDNVTVTRDDVFKAPHWIISVEGPKMVELEIPYITNQRWWPRTFTGNFSTVSAAAPSNFYIFMYNEALIQNSSADAFYINVYASGGSTFEVSVPVQPALGLGFDPFFYDDNTYINPIAGKIADTSSFIAPAVVDDTIQVDTVAAAEKDKIHDHAITQYPKRREFSYRTTNKDSSGRPRARRALYIVEFKDRYLQQGFAYLKQKKRIIIEYQYGLLHNVSNYSYFIPFDSKENAYKAADQQQTYDNTSYASMPGYINYKDVPKDENGDYVVTPLGYGQNQQLVILSATASEVLPDTVQAQNERDGVQVATLSSVRVLNRTQFGKQDFGENFNDLMNLCRRYQKYGTIKMTQQMLDAKDKCAFYFTCNPQGLGKLNLGNHGNGSQVFGRCREGPIPLLLSGYRYFRGSLRFRLVFPACKDTLIWVQHRPDRPSRPQSLNVCDDIRTAQAVYNHGYATEIQLANINTVIEFEVPFYQYDAYGLLQTPADVGDAYDYQYGLGQIFVGIQCSPDDIKTFTNRNCEIYYSLADDFSPSLFYGFPKMVVLDDIPEDIEPVPKLLAKEKFDFEVVTGQAQGWRDKVPFLNKIKSEVRTEVIDTVQEEVKPIVEAAVDEMKKTLDALGSSQTVKQRILLTLTNLCHCIAHPDFRSLAIAFGSMLADIGIFCVDSISAVCDFLTKIFKKLYAPDATEHTDKIKMQGNSESEDETLIASWFSMLFGAISTIFAYKGSKSAPQGKGVQLFLKDFSFAMRGAQGVFTFIKNSFAAIKHIVAFCFSKCDPKYKVLDDIVRNQDVISFWLRESLFLINPTNIAKHSVNDDYIERVFIAYDYGQLLMCNIPCDKDTHPFYVKLNQLFQQLSKLKSQLLHMGKHPHIRKEPFGVYMYGDAGIGKSQLRENTCIELLKHVGHKFESQNVFCTIDGSQKFWDQCNHQPVLVIDDLWNIREGEIFQEQIRIMFAIFSDVPLTPPKAELREKGMRYNPEIVWISSNKEGISGNNINVEAINRRRNVCIEAVLWRSDIEEFRKKDCPHCEDPSISLAEVAPKFLEDYHHMRFFVHTLSRENSFLPNATTRGNMLTYPELLDLLKIKYQYNRIYEAARFDRKYNRLKHLVLDYNEDEEYSSFFTSFTGVDKLSFSQQYETYKTTQLRMLEQLRAEHDGHWINTGTKWCKDNLKEISNRYWDCTYGKTKKYVKKYLLRKTAESATTYETVVDDKLCKTLNALLPNTVELPKSNAAPIPVEPIVEATAEIHVVPHEDLDDAVEALSIDSVGLPSTPEPEWDNFDGYNSEDGAVGGSGVVAQSDDPINLVDIAEDLLEAHPFADINGDMIANALPRAFRNHFVPDLQRELIRLHFRNNARAHNSSTWDDKSIKEAIENAYSNPQYAFPSEQMFLLNIGDNNNTLQEFCNTILSGIHYAFTPWIFGHMSKVQQSICVRIIKKIQLTTAIRASEMYWFIRYLATFDGDNFVSFRKSHHDQVIKMLDTYGKMDQDFLVLFRRMVNSPTFLQSVFPKPLIQSILQPTSCGDTYCFHDSDHLHNFVLRDKNYVFIGRQPIDICRYCRLDSPLYAKIFFHEFLKVNPFLLRKYKQGDTTFSPIDELPSTVPLDCNIVNDIFKGIVLSWKRQVKPMIYKVLEYMCEYAPFIAIIGTFVGALGVDYYICKEYSKSLKTIEKQEIAKINSGWQAYKPSKSKDVPIPQGAYNQTARNGSASSLRIPRAQSQQSEAIPKIVSRNMFSLIMYDDSGEVFQNYRCLGLVDHTAIILRHFVDTTTYLMRIHPTRVFNFMIELSENFCKVGSRTINITKEQFLNGLVMFNSVSHDEYGDRVDCAHRSNICLWHLPVQIPSFRNVLKYIPSKSEICRANSDGFIVNEEIKEKIPLKYVSNKSFFIPEDVTNKHFTEAVAIENYWQYPKQAAGLCMSVIISSNLQNPLMGIHIAGNPNNNTGFAEILCKETFDSLNLFDTPAEHKQEIELEPVNFDEIKFQGPICVLGKVPKKLANPTPTKTKITKTLVHGHFPVNTYPNPLSAYDKRLPEQISPLISGVEKHGLFVKDFPQKFLSRAFDDLNLKLLISVPSLLAKPRKLTLSEAVCGTGEIKYVDALNWTTSAGFPLKQYKPASETGKKWLFTISSNGDKHEVVDMHPQLKNQLAIDDYMRNNKIKPFTVFTDCLKDTCIPADKCSIPGKTRIFSISPVQYTIRMRQYFGLFAASFRNARFRAEHAIGINVNSLEWTQLTMHLSFVGNKIVTGDYSNFGPGLHLSVVRKACDIILSWCIFNKVFEDNDIDYAKILIDELVDRYHLCENLIYIPPAGAPSGSPITDILNSIVNMLYIRVAWLEIVSESLDVFHNAVRLVTYGDDLIMSVSDQYINKFNSVTLCDFFKKYNIKFTDQTKTGDIVPYRSLSTATFLKCGFARHPLRPSIFLAPIDLDSIYGCLNWNKGCLSLIEGTAVNIRQALELAYGHGPEFYTELLNKLIDLINTHKLSVQLLTWLELDSRIFDDGYIIGHNYIKAF